MEIKTTVITIGNGGFNIAREIFLSGTFTHPEFIIVDTKEDELKLKEPMKDLKRCYCLNFMEK